jgi:hypothetical protein
MRRYSYRMKNHMRTKVRPKILTPEFVRRVVAPDLPRMRRYFHAPQLCSATIAVARKLAGILYRMWKDGTTFRWSAPESKTA